MWFLEFMSLDYMAETVSMLFQELCLKVLKIFRGSVETALLL